MKTVAIIGTFDTKGSEFNFLKKAIHKQGLKTLLINGGAFDSTIKTDIENGEVSAAVGVDIEEIQSKKDRAFATDILSKGMEVLVPKLYEQGEFDGIISLGGTGGTSLAAPAMRSLPIGVPKLIVSTVASADVSMYVGTSDIVMMPSIVDVSGLNSVSTQIFTNAANAICGMLKFAPKKQQTDKPHIAASMFGVTTIGVDYARKYLEERGYEVLVFHATGTGGRTMENLIESGFFDGVLDLTTTEWCDELVGGVLAAGPHRLEAAGKHKVPQVVAPGALDMVNFGPYDSVPEKFLDRKLYRHNPTVTLMRTTVEENKELGNILAEKLNAAKGPTVLMLPLAGLSAIDATDQPFYGKEEDEVLFDTLREKIDPGVVELIEMQNNINDKEFAEAAAQKLIDILDNQ